MDESAIFRTIHYFTTASVILPLLFGMLYWRHLDKGMVILEWNLLLNLSVELLGLFMAIQQIGNLWVYNLYSPIEVILVFLAFRIWNEHGIVRKAILYGIGAFIVFWAVILLMQGNEQAVNIILTFESVLMVIFAVATLFSALNKDQVPILKNPAFWVSSAYLLYFAGNLFLFAMIKALFVLSEWKNAWILHSLLNLVKNLLLLGGFLACRKNLSSSSAAPLSS